MTPLEARISVAKLETDIVDELRAVLIKHPATSQREEILRALKQLGGNTSDLPPVRVEQQPQPPTCATCEAKRPVDFKGEYWGHSCGLCGKVLCSGCWQKDGAVASYKGCATCRV